MESNQLQLQALAWGNRFLGSSSFGAVNTFVLVDKIHQRRDDQFRFEVLRDIQIFRLWLIGAIGGSFNHKLHSKVCDSYAQPIMKDVAFMGTVFFELWYVQTVGKIEARQAPLAADFQVLKVDLFLLIEVYVVVRR